MTTKVSFTQLLNSSFYKDDNRKKTMWQFLYNWFTTPNEYNVKQFCKQVEVIQTHLQFVIDESKERQNESYSIRETLKSLLSSNNIAKSEVWVVVQHVEQMAFNFNKAIGKIPNLYSKSNLTSKSRNRLLRELTKFRNEDSSKKEMKNTEQYLDTSNIITQLVQDIDDTKQSAFFNQYGNNSVLYKSILDIEEYIKYLEHLLKKTTSRAGAFKMGYEYQLKGLKDSVILTKVKEMCNDISDIDFDFNVTMSASEVEKIYQQYENKRDSDKVRKKSLLQARETMGVNKDDTNEKQQGVETKKMKVHSGTNGKFQGTEFILSDIENDWSSCSEVDEQEDEMGEDSDEDSDELYDAGFKKKRNIKKKSRRV